MSTPQPPSTDPLAQLQALSQSASRQPGRPAAQLPTASQADGLIRLVFEGLPAPCWIVDGGGAAVVGNDAAKQWLLPTPQAGNARGFLAAFALPDQARILSVLGGLAVGQMAFLKPCQLTDDQGELHEVELQLRRLPLPSGNPPYFCVQVLRPTLNPDSPTELLQALVHDSDDSMYALDTEGRILFVNEAGRRALNLPRDQIVGQAREKILPVRDAIEHRLTDQQVLKTGEVVRRLESIHGPEGSRMFQTHKFPLRDSRGNVLGVGAISRDMTDTHAKQSNLLQSEAIFQYSRDAIVVTDPQGHIQRVNPSWVRMTGFSESSAIGHTLRILHAQEADELAYQAMWNTLQLQDHWKGELVNRTAAGQRLIVRTSIVALRDEEAQLIGYVAIQSDITDLRLAYNRIEELASTDTLTGLPNRGLFQDRLHQTLLLAQRSHQPFALLFIDLDYFKEVNDSLGHDVGDALLVAVAERMRSAVRAHDTVARLGGDEFVVLMPDVGHELAHELATRLLQAIQRPLPLAGDERYRPQASVGLVVYPDDGDGAVVLMQRADQAMYAAKHSGRNRLKRCAEDQYAATVMTLHQELLHALENGELRLFLEPKFRLSDCQVVGAEALVRWQHPRKGLLGPADFLPMARQHQLLNAVDSWMMDQALHWLALLQRAGRLPQGWRLAVNQNTEHFLLHRLADTLPDRMRALDLTPDMLDIELTEEWWAKASTELVSEMQKLKALGVRLCVDDFGTGYSSLSTLVQLPVSVVKIDQSFVRNIEHHEQDRAMVEAILHLAQRLKLDNSVEGVETESQRSILLDMGCHLGQGFLLSPPLPADDFVQLFLS